MKPLNSIRSFTLAVGVLMLVAQSHADWRQELDRFPIAGSPKTLDETNCVPLMLEAFHASGSVKALVFMPGATDELYFFHRVRVTLKGAASLTDALVALTNQTPIQATWRAPFLILHTGEDPINPIGSASDAATAERIKQTHFSTEARFDDRDWETLQPFLTNALAIAVEPGADSPRSHHFFRHSFAVGDLTGWQLLEAVAMAGKTKFRIERDQVVFEGDTRTMAIPSVPTNFLASELEPPSLKRIGTIPLEGVTGRLDHLAADPASGRLFVAALGNNSIEVVDINRHQRIHEITGVEKPQGLAFAAQSKLLLACSGGDGTVYSFDAERFAKGTKIPLGKDADNIRLQGSMAVVGSGGGQEAGLLSAINLGAFGSRQVSGTEALLAQVRLPAHPESFQVAPDNRRIFVNVPTAHQIAVIDTETTNWSVRASWPVDAAHDNFPMALDWANRRLFVACRAPACVQAYNSDTGALLFQAPCVGDADDLFYDPALQRLYVIGGGGAVDIFMVPGNAQDAVPLAHVLTRPKARTGFFIPELRMLAVAAPRTENEAAQILLFRTEGK